MTLESWDLKDWNAALVRHFFLKEEEEPDLVEIHNLLVTEEQFKVICDALDPEEARKHFFLSLRAALRTGREPSPLVEDAVRLCENWNPLSLTEVPPFFAHIFAVCCAAALCEDPNDPVGVHINLRESVLEMDEETYAQPSFREFPQLIEAFAKWTRDNSDRYRILILPTREEIDDQRMSLIGQAVTLTFPRATDIARVTECLSDFIERGAEPTMQELPRMVESIRERSTGFGRVFRQKLDQFSALLRDRSYEEIARHPLWEAIRTSLLYERDADRLREPWLFAEPEFPDGYAFSILAPGQISMTDTSTFYPAGYETEWLPAAPGDRRSAERLLCGDSDMERRALHEAPRLIRRIRQGVLLFKPTMHAWMEVSRDRAYEDVQFALVRQGPLAAAYIEKFGGQSLHCSAPGWTLVAGSRPRLLLAQDPEGPLSGVSCLSPVPTTAGRRFSLSGGIKYGGEILGNGFRNPIVRVAQMANLRLLENDADPIPLQKEGDHWRLPRGLHLEGTFHLAGDPAGADLSTELTVVRFGPGPDRPLYPPPVAQNYLVEALGGFRSMADRPAYLPPSTEIADLSHLFRRSVRIGKNLGEFPPVSDSWDVGWALNWNGEGWKFDFIASGDTARCSGAECSCEEGTLARRITDLRPEGMAGSKPQRTRWREFLLKAKPLTPCAGRIRSALRPYMERPSNMPTLEGRSFCILPNLQSGRSTIQGAFSDSNHQNLLGIRRTVAALAHDRTSGLEYVDWIDAVRHFIGEAVSPFEMLRTWEESGRLSVFPQARWNRSKIFPEAPGLGLFTTLEGLHAIATGLWSPEQEMALETAFRGAGWSSRHAESIGGMAEPLLRWFGGGETSGVPLFLRDASSRESLQLKALNVNALLQEWGSNQYDAPGRPLPPFDEAESTDVPLLGVVNRHRRRNAPTFWSVPEHTGLWSYSRAFALALLAKAKSMEPFQAMGGQAIKTAHRQIHLPLPLARLAAWTGATIPGPIGLMHDRSSGWVYEFSSEAVRDEVLSTMVELLRHRTQPTLENSRA